LADQVSFALRGGEAWRSPWEDYRRLRDEAPLLSVETPTGRYWVLSRFADVFDAVRDTETFSSADGLTPDTGAMEIFAGEAAPIVMMDPPDHTAMRRLVSRPFTPRRVAALDAAITDFVDDRLDQVGTTPVDIIEVLFKPLPSFVVAQFLGVPDEDRSQFDAWTSAIVAASATGTLATAADAAMELFGFASELMERRRVEPGPDVVSDLVTLGPEHVSSQWIVGFVFTMVTGGNDTMTGLLGGAAELLTDARDQRDRLLDGEVEMPLAIEEFLRLTSPVQNLARTITVPVTRHGHTIPAGEKVLLVYGAANRDPRQFGEDAERLDVGRTSDRMLSFGYGPHHCLGAASARLQARVALTRLLARFPEFTVDSAAGRFASGGFVRRFESLPMIR